MSNQRLISGASPTPMTLWRDELWRIWDPSRPIGAFIGLNPSTADATTDDHTIRKEMGFAKRWGWGGFYKFNLFTFRSTDPKGLWQAIQPVGPNGDKILATIRNRELAAVVAAWGAFSHGLAKVRANKVLKTHLAGVPLFTIGPLTSKGCPPHPLMLPYERVLQPWSPLVEEPGVEVDSAAVPKDALP